MFETYVGRYYMSAQRQETYDLIAAIIAQQLSKQTSEITDSSTFDSLGADSLDRVEIVLNIEEKFDIEVDDEAVEKLKTIGELVDYVQKLRS